LLGSIPAIYKDDAKPKSPLNRSGEGSKLGADVHGAPTDLQEG